MTPPRRPRALARAGNTRGRLIGLTFVAAIPITAMAVTIALQAFEATARGSQERASLLDGQALAQYRNALGTVTGRLSSLAATLASPGCAAPPTGLDDGPRLLAIDVDGKVLCRIGPPLDPAPPYHWFERVRGGASLAIGPSGPDGGTVVAVPAGGGAVAAEILPPSWAASVLLPDLPQPTDAVWLLDDQRAVLASRGDAEAALPTVATMVSLIGANQLALRANAASGARYAYATTALADGSRVITATSARREDAAALQELLVRLAELIAFLLAGLGTIVLGADIAFGQPLRRLSHAVRRWQDGASFDPGDFTGAPDEVQQLAQSFRDATAVLRQKEAELIRARERQDLLVMEVHHRVKNNLQVIASLLNLQASRIRVPEARAEFQAARDRVRALATLHRHLYADGELHTINMRSFLTELCEQLFQAMGETTGDRIQMVIDAPELRMSSDQAVPLSLIVTEAVTNSVRYAFPGGRAGRVEVSLTERDGSLDLVIRDDGVGIQAVRPAAGAGARDGIGLQLIRGFSRQLGATLSIEEGQGTRYAVRLARQHPRPAALDAAAAPQDSAA